MLLLVTFSILLTLVHIFPKQFFVLRQSFLVLSQQQCALLQVFFLLLAVSVVLTHVLPTLYVLLQQASVHEQCDQLLLSPKFGAILQPAVVFGLLHVLATSALVKPILIQVFCVQLPIVLKPYVARFQVQFDAD
jgi:hypothetical protein